MTASVIIWFIVAVILSVALLIRIVDENRPPLHPHLHSVRHHPRQ